MFFLDFIIKCFINQNSIKRQIYAGKQMFIEFSKQI